MCGPLGLHVCSCTGPTWFPHMAPGSQTRPMRSPSGTVNGGTKYATLAPLPCGPTRRLTLCMATNTSSLANTQLNKAPRRPCVDKPPLALTTYPITGGYLFGALPTPFRHIAWPLPMRKPSSSCSRLRKTAAPPPSATASGPPGFAAPTVPHTPRW